MNYEPLVSVIVIFLNEERFLQEAIDSVFAQTYRAWELILVDDGSTDTSSKIAQLCAEQYPEKVQYLTHEGQTNRGMSTSRNLGIARSGGEYIGFLDADDVWFPDKLEEQVAVLAANPEASMVYGPTEWWFSWTGQQSDAERDFVLPLGIEPNRVVPPPELLVRFLEDEGISPCTCSILVRREAIDSVGGFEERFRTLYEDQAFLAKVCLHLPVYASDRCWCRYRQHEGTSLAIAKQTGQTRALRRSFLNWLRAYLLQNGFSDSEVWWVLQGQFRANRWIKLARVTARVRQIAAPFRDYLRPAEGGGGQMSCGSDKAPR